MSNKIRINRVIREFNISLDRIVDFLSSKGQEIIDARPTSKITKEQWLLISKEFNTDRRYKSISKKLKAEDIDNAVLAASYQRLSFKSNIISRPKKNTGIKASYSSSIDETTLGKLKDLKKLIKDREIKIVKENQEREKRKKDEQKQRIANEIKKKEIEEQKRKKEETENKIKDAKQNENFKNFFKNKKPIEFFPNLKKEHSKLKASYYLLHYTYENKDRGGYKTEIRINHEKLISEFEKTDFNHEFKVNTGDIYLNNHSKSQVLGNKILGPEITDYMNLKDIIRIIEQKNNALLEVLDYYNKQVFDFKDGYKPDFFASIFISSFGKNFFSDKILIPISASTSEKNEKRYREFINYICIFCGATNGMDIFKTENREATHQGNQAKISFLNSEKKEQIRNKKIILIDDMFTKGVQSNIWLNEINKFSPSQIECVYLAKGLWRNKDFKNNEKVRILNPIYAERNSIFLWYLDDKNKSFSLRNVYDIDDGKIVEISDTNILKGGVASEFWITVRFPSPSFLNDQKTYSIIIPKHFLIRIESNYLIGKQSETINFWPNFVDD